MKYQCQYSCNCIFVSDDERSRHEKTCRQKIVGCCQSSVSSCKREVQDWLLVSTSPQHEQFASMVSCDRHNSNGIFGAIKENNIDLVQYFLQELKDTLVKVLTYESKFGDSIITFACSLGRVEVVQFFMKTIQHVVHSERDRLTMSDLIDFETSKGKTPLIESVRCNQADIVSILLSHKANAKLVSKTHHKSGLQWAIALGHRTIITLIEDHLQLEEHVCSLFKAVSKGDIASIKSLTEGGVPFQYGQDSQFQIDLESKRCQLANDKDTLIGVSDELQHADEAKAQTKLGIQELESHIKDLVKKREETVTSRRSKTALVTAKVRLALTTSNISQVCDMENPPPEYELISKALCTLFHIKVKAEAPNPDQPNMVHWHEIQKLLQGNLFFHRIRHYHFESEVVELASKATVDGLPGTCSDHLSTMMSNVDQDTHVRESNIELGSIILSSTAHWLWAIFQSLPGHQLENQLIMEESCTRGDLEGTQIDHDVLTSRCAILKREIDDITSSIKACTNQISQLERKLTVSKVMKHVAADGHSILSWAAGVGNEDVVKLLLKRGSHTAIGDDCLDWCATMIQVAYRRYLKKKEVHYEDRSMQEGQTRIQHDLAVSLRLKSLSNLIRERLKSLRLPLAEALCNGHSNVVSALYGSDVSLFQAVNLFPLFSRPIGMLPRSSSGSAQNDSSNLHLHPNGTELLSAVTKAGNMYHFEQDPDCKFVESLKYTIQLTDDFFNQREDKTEEKILVRRDTLRRKHRSEMATQLKLAMLRGDFEGIVQASESGGIHLDYEDSNSGMTPLVRAAMEDIHSPVHTWLTNIMGKPVTAVASLLDRISPNRPSVDYENKHGHTALAMAVLNERLEVIQDLLDRGADVNRVSSKLNCTVYDLAVREKKDAVVEFLDQVKLSGV